MSAITDKLWGTRFHTQGAELQVCSQYLQQPQRQCATGRACGD